MNALLKIILFMSLLKQICFAQWVQVGLNSETIKDVTVKDETIFAVTADSGKLFRSTDRGVNWTMVVESNAVDVAIAPTGKVYLIKKDTIVFGQDEGNLYTSLDDGNTWIWSDIEEQIRDSMLNGIGWPERISVSPTGNVFCGIIGCIPFIPIQVYSILASSVDDGLTWLTPINGGLLFDFRNQFVITIGGIGGLGSYFHIVLSSDNGNNWDYLGAELHFLPTALCIFSNGNIIIGTYYDPGVLLISTDNCSSWDTLYTMQVQTGLSFTSELIEGMFVGTENLGVFLFSDEGDSLGSWNEGLTSLNIQTLTLDNNGYIYAGTENGVWRRPLNDIVTSVEDETIEPTDLLLFQNYPNPFNPDTKISWQSPISSHHTIKVFDVLGKEVATLVDEYKPAGRYEVEFHAGKLPSGVYFYQLKSGEFISTKKMILKK